MSTELVEHARNQGIQVTKVGGGGQFDESDYTIPWVKRIQASAEEVKTKVASPGEFLHSEAGAMESINFVPLHVQATRDFYDADAGKNICSSQDRITGWPNDKRHFEDYGVEVNGALACADCPFNNMPQWEKKACKKGYTITGYDVDSESPFLFRVKGAAVREFQNRFVGAYAMGRTMPWARQYEMTAVLKRNEGNSWFGPSLQPTKSNDESEQQFYQAMAEGYGPPVHSEEAASIDPDDLPFE